VTRRAGRARARRTARRASRPSGLSAAEKRTLVTTALELIERFYVHLPLKRAMYAVNPAQRLRLLTRRLDADDPALTDRTFYDELLGTFAELRDLHTSFILPEPFRSTTAYLPFSVETCQMKGACDYLVSHVIEGDAGIDAARAQGFERGVTVTHWNGVPIDRAVAVNADRELGSNPAARRAQGLAAMTIRWLGQSLPPDEHWVDVTFRPLSPKDAATATARFAWRAFQQDAVNGHGVARAKAAVRDAVGMDERGEVERQIRRALFRPPAATHARASARPAKVPAATGDGAVPSRLPDVFPTCRNITTRAGTFGYLRLATFNVEDDGPFVDEFIRLVTALSPRGLILDVRRNGGGLIPAGERLLQLLTPRRIEPARFHFLNTPRTARLAADHAFLAPWKRSIDQAVETGTDFSQGFGLLAAERCNDIGQKYHGPVVLVTDALCYSTTDIFAAGFQDHAIGTIVGVDHATGAGGANVWEYPLIAALARDPRVLPLTLPREASFRFAVRRVTRVGANAGMPLEDIGVVPDVFHETTRRDLLESNADLIAHAIDVLKTQPTQTLTVERASARACRVTTANLDVVDAYLDVHPLVSHRVHTAHFTLDLPRGTGRAPAPRVLRLEGFRKGALVAAARLALR
jgi:C-terminal processing protease CtpA/Prc